MSHTTVAIRVPADVSLSGIEKYVEKILRPYNEQDEEFLEFVDNTQEYLVEFETKTIEQVQTTDGKYFFSWELKDCIGTVVQRTFKEACYDNETDREDEKKYSWKISWKNLSENHEGLAKSFG